LVQIRQTSAILHIIRCFDDPNVIHVNRDINPERHAEIIETELLLSDLETLEKKFEKTKRQAKSGDKQLLRDLEIIEKLIKHCGDGLCANTIQLENTEHLNTIKSLHLLTNNPILYVANLTENEIVNNIQNKYVKRLNHYPKIKGGSLIPGFSFHQTRNFILSPFKKEKTFFKKI
jgi:Predicted GTPase, probable translation factor